MSHIRTDMWHRPRGLEPALQKNGLVYIYIYIRPFPFFLKLMSYYQRHYHLSLSRVYLDICDSDTAYSYVPTLRLVLNQGLAAARTALHCLCTNVHCIFWRYLRNISDFTGKFLFWWRIYECVYRHFRMCCCEVRVGGIPNFETWV